MHKAPAPPGAGTKISLPAIRSRDEGEGSAHRRTQDIVGRLERGGRPQPLPSTSGEDDQDIQYPNYQQVLPQNQENPVLLDTASLINALERAKVLLTDKHDGIRLRFEEAQVHLSARNLENESFDDKLDIINPQALQIDTGLNINYLMDAVRNIEGENLQVHLTEGERPCLLTSQADHDVRYVIMPMRL